MPDQKLTVLPQLTTPAADDLLYIVDVSNTSEDPAGSSRRVLVSDACQAVAGCALFDHFADASSTSTDGTENDLYSDTTAADTLATNGDKIEAWYGLTTVSSATANRRIRAYFGGTLVCDSGTITTSSAGHVELGLLILRETSSVVRVIARLVVTGATFQPTATYTRITGLTLSSTNILKVTGTASGTGAASGDIVAKLGTVVKYPVAS